MVESASGLTQSANGTTAAPGWVVSLILFLFFSLHSSLGVQPFFFNEFKVMISVQFHTLVVVFESVPLNHLPHVSLCHAVDD